MSFRLGFLLIQNLAEQDIDDLLGKGLVAGDAGGHARQVVSQVAEDCLKIRRLLQVLPLVTGRYPRFAGRTGEYSAKDSYVREPSL